MKLYSLLDEDKIQLNLRAGSLEEAARQMLQPLQERLGPGGEERALAALMERENSRATSLTDGVYVPHARLDWVEEFHLLLGSSAEGIPSGEPGSPPIHLIFLILTPLTKNTLMLQTLAAVARLVSSPETRQALIRVKAPNRALKIIEDSGIDVKKTLCANDIMNPIEITLAPDMALTRGMQVLFDIEDEGVPVLNEAGEMLGELAASDIISLGLPKYMDLMENPSMLGNVEPFEHFFKKERFLKVGDLLREDVMRIAPEAPVVQIAHQMLTEKRRRAYVLRDGKLLGKISRKDIVAKVLML